MRPRSFVPTRRFTGGAIAASGAIFAGCAIGIAACAMLPARPASPPGYWESRAPDPTCAEPTSRFEDWPCPAPEPKAPPVQSAGAGDAPTAPEPSTHDARGETNRPDAAPADGEAGLDAGRERRAARSDPFLWDDDAPLLFLPSGPASQVAPGGAPASAPETVGDRHQHNESEERQERDESEERGQSEGRGESNAPPR